MSVVRVLDRKLVDDAEDIVLQRIVLEINQIDHAGDTVLRRKLDAFDHPFIDLVQCGEVALRTRKTDILPYLPDFVGGQVVVGLVQKLFKVIDIKHIPQGTARHAAPSKILPALCLQKGDEGVFVVRLTVAAVIALEIRHYLSSLVVRLDAMDTRRYRSKVSCSTSRGIITRLYSATIAGLIVRESAYSTMLWSALLQSNTPTDGRHLCSRCLHNLSCCRLDN